MVISPAVLTGKPIIKGTRLAVEFIIDLLAHIDLSRKSCGFPGLTYGDNQACHVG